MRIYTVFEKGTNTYWQSHNLFLESYRARDWNAAAASARDLASHMPFMADYYAMMIERIEDLSKNDPGEGWDTVFRSQSK